MATGREEGVPLRILEAVHAVNEDQKSYLAEKVETYYEGALEGRTFAVWGLAFKPNTDDMREAPSLVIIERLLAAGAKVQAYDPVAMSTAHAHLGDRITYASSGYDALTGADALLLLTEWPEFRQPDLTKLKARMKSPVIFDGRNVYPPAQMGAAGFDYFSIGRPPVLGFKRA